MIDITIIRKDHPDPIEVKKHILLGHLIVDTDPDYSTHTVICACKRCLSISKFLLGPIPMSRREKLLEDFCKNGDWPWEIIKKALQNNGILPTPPPTST